MPKKKPRKRAPGAGRPAVLREPVRFSVQIERRDMAALVEHSIRRDATVADLIRAAVRRWLASPDPVE